MSNQEFVPLEATTAAKSQQIISTHVGANAFLATLTAEQQRRYQEIIHHVYHEGVEDGMTRPRAITAEQQLGVLLYETDLFLLGATYQSELREGE